MSEFEPVELDRQEDVGLKGGARQPRGSARFSCEGGFAEKSPAPVTLDRRAEMVIVALRHSRPADIERARRQRNFGDKAAVEPLAVERLHEGLTVRRDRKSTRLNSSH